MPSALLFPNWKIRDSWILAVLMLPKTYGLSGETVIVVY